MHTVDRWFNPNGDGGTTIIGDDRTVIGDGGSCGIGGGGSFEEWGG